jgi:3-phosphoshikimate 1-carboxyvinyltransferase
MSDAIEMIPVTGSVKGRIRPPGSKSLTNRALVVASLANGSSRLTGVLDSQDTRVMIDSLQRLGLKIQHDPANCVVEIEGCGGRFPNAKADLWLENSGTSIRFLTAMCALGHGEYRLDGNERMRERPIGELVKGLQHLGVDLRCELGTDCPPVMVHANGLNGGLTKLPGNVSSQFLSALLMAAPGARETLDIQLEGILVSEPYIDMTLGVMATFGVQVQTPQQGLYQVQPQSYKAANYDVEPDASAASYFFALAAITGGDITVEGLSRWSLQGDIHFVEALEKMGCDVRYEENAITVRGKPLKGIDIDMNAISDTAQTLAVVAPFADGPTRIHNVKHMRFKETDRVSALVCELRKLGLQIEEADDGLTIHPGPIQPASIKTYDDHRMAMSFALIGQRVPGVWIEDPGCTRKTYPKYFEDLAKLIRG